MFIPGLCVCYDKASPTTHCDKPAVARQDGKELCAEHSPLFPDRKPRKAQARCNGHNTVWTAYGERPVPCTRYADKSGYCRDHR